MRPRAASPRVPVWVWWQSCAQAPSTVTLSSQLSTALGLGSAGLCSARSAAQSQGHRALRCAKLTSAPRLKILKHVTALTQIQRAPCLPLTEAGGTEHGAWSAGIHVKTPGAALPPLQRSVPFLNPRSSVLEPHLSDPDRTELIDTCLASVLALPPDPGPERDGISSDALHKEVRVGHGGCPAGVAQRGGAALFAPSAAPAAFTAPCPPLSGCPSTPPRAAARPWERLLAIQLGTSGEASCTISSAQLSPEKAWPFCALIASEKICAYQRAQMLLIRARSPSRKKIK